MNISHNRIPLQHEMRECLREEHKLHEQVSDIKNEPLLWDMRASKVTCRLPQKEFNNTDALLVKADELWWHAQRFQVMEIDKGEIKLRESLTCKIRVYNKLHKLEDHMKIVDYLGISDDQVKSVRQLPGRGWQLSWLELVLDSPNTVNKAMAWKLGLQHVPEEWLRMCQVFRVLTCLEKYIDELKKEEKKIRIMIANREMQWGF